ncbi:hypothetical protein I4F81_005357 [Pyropia yezoensis]|uniref:Uncharacterized protein n=1 Tax=Pyropia yezoensis TaxID=2788 RepID=A0ACC3BYG4_PYRYE|nr:hypothetical protein I4F81_005357 [Neopyropia yezoensis]
MEEVTSEIAAALTSIPSPGAFCTSGTLRTLPSTGLHLRGEAGAALGLPLSDAGASAFKAAATPAPFGRGSATVVDPTVRSALQAAVRLAPSFVPALTAKVLPHVCSRLGVAPVADVALQLDKAVLYEVGGHFARHQDTQRSAGMFGTLVLVLPTAARHAGGVLEVSHQGDTRDVDSAAMLYPDIDGEGEEEEAAAAPAACFVAFFADCYHRLRKVTAGRRFCLLFNLVRVESSPSAGRAFGRADVHADRRARIGAAVRRWEALPDGNTVLAVPLRHMYTKQGLAFRNLKPEDAAVAKVLQACTTGSGGGAERLLVTHLVTVERCVRGIPDSDSCYDSRDASGGRHFIEDVLEEDVSPELWRNEADEEVKDPDLMVYVSGGDGDGGDDVISEMKEDFELWPEEPDRETYEPYMGNWGPTVEQFYHTALLVLWPRSRGASVPMPSGLKEGVSFVRKRLPQGVASAAVAAAIVDALRALGASALWSAVCSVVEASPAEATAHLVALADGVRSLRSGGSRGGGSLCIDARVSAVALGDSAALGDAAAAAAARHLCSRPACAPALAALPGLVAEWRPAAAASALDALRKMWRAGAAGAPPPVRAAAAALAERAVAVTLPAAPGPSASAGVQLLARRVTAGLLWLGGTDALLDGWATRLSTRGPTAVMAVMACPAVRAAVAARYVPAIARLAAARVAALSVPRPVADYRLPHARPPRDPDGFPTDDFMAFLRSPDREREIRGFERIADARDYAAVFAAERHTGYHVRGSTSGGGRYSKAHFVKINDAHIRDNERWSAGMADVSTGRVAAPSGGAAASPYAAASAAAGGGASPSAVASAAAAAGGGSASPAAADAATGGVVDLVSDSDEAGGTTGAPCKRARIDGTAGSPGPAGE